MKKTLFIILFALLTASIYSNQGSYKIDDIIYEIDGSTRPFFLERRIGIDREINFATLEEVEEYRLFIEQELINLRLYENLEVTFSVEDNLVIYKIVLDEAWNLVPIPYIKGSTNEGGRVAAKLFWNNSLGTLTDTLFQGGINVGLDPDGNMDLQRWNLGTKVSDIYIGRKAYSLSIDQELTNSARGEEKWQYYSTSFSVGTSYELTEWFNYSPRVKIRFNYLYDDVYNTIDKKDIPQKPTVLSYIHGFDKSNVDWTENFRNGYSYGIGNEVSLIYDLDTREYQPTTEFDLYGAYYKTLGDLPMYIALKGKGIIALNDEMLEVASNIRGVEDSAGYGYMGLFFNSNIYISVIKIDGFAEAIFAPSFDIGIMDNSGLDYGTGADFILYVDKLKSMVARGTVAIDPRSFSEISDFTDFIKALEIEVTSSLFF